MFGLVPIGAAHAAPRCTPNVGNSGLSAAVVAHAHQSITDRHINATSCDIGIYIGPGARHVRVDHVRVTGANFQGIFAEKTSHVVIEDSVVAHNGFHTTDPTAPPLPGSGVQSFVGQAFAISVFGVSHASVKDNAVYDNGRGGIGIMDNGPNDPGIMLSHQDPAAPVVGSSYIRVVRNHTWSNFSGCGLVAATQNVAGSLSHLTLAHNRISGTGMSATNGPDIGGIVVAADLPNSRVRDVTVWRNRVTGSFEGGVIVNAEAFNASTRRVRVLDNTVSGNNWGALEAPQTAGVIVYENPAPIPPGTSAPVNVDTVVAGNTITRQFFGIWSTGHFPPKTWNNHIRVTTGGVPISIG